MLKFESNMARTTPDSLTVIEGRNRNSCIIKRGENTFIGGPSSVTGKILHSIVFRSLAVSDGIVLWIDGGNSFDPYRISELAERCGYDGRKMLSRIRIARAFTAHQMEAIARSASKEARGNSISILVVSSVAELFTGEVGWKEGMDLLKSTVGNLGKLAENCGAWSVMTSGISVSSSAEMERIVDENFARVVNVELENEDLYLESDGQVLAVSRWSEKRHQRSILEFTGRGDRAG